MCIGGRRTIGVCLSLVAALSARGQDRPNGFFLTSPLIVSAGYEENLFTGSGQLNDMATILTGPTFEWIRNTHRMSFFVNYLPEFELFSANPSLDAWNQSASTRLDYRIDSRNSLSFSDSFLDTKDSSRQLENSLVILPYGQFLQNTFYGEYHYRWNTLTKLTARLDNAVTTANLPGPLNGRLNEVGTAGTITLDRSLTSKHSLSVSYSFLHVHPLSSDLGGSPTNVNLLILGYAYQINPTLLLRLTGGAIEGSESAFNGAAVVEKQLGDVWLAGGYQRYLGFFEGLPVSGEAVPGATGFANGVAPVSVYQVVSLRATGQLTRRLKLTALGEKSITGADNGGFPDRSLIGKLRMSYKLNQRVSLFAQAEHYGQNENLFFNTSLNRNRFFAGIEITISRPPETQGGADPRHKGAAGSEDQIKDGQGPGGGEWYR
jgi:hypothetical protein